MTNAIRFYAHGGAQVLKFEAIDVPAPGPGQVQMRHTAIGLNKIDRVAKPKLLPVIDQYRSMLPFKEVVPFSALKGENVDRLEAQLLAYLPEGDRLYPEDFLIPFAASVGMARSDKPELAVH